MNLEVQGKLFENLAWLPPFQFPNIFAQEAQGSLWLYEISGGAAHEVLVTGSEMCHQLSRRDQGLTLLTRSKGDLALPLGQVNSRKPHILYLKRNILRDRGQHWIKPDYA